MKKISLNGIIKVCIIIFLISSSISVAYYVIPKTDNDQKKETANEAVIPAKTENKAEKEIAKSEVPKQVVAPNKAKEIASNTPSPELLQLLERTKDRWASQQSFSSSLNMICNPSRKTFCSEGKCTDMKASVWVTIEPALKTASRCDSKGCDNYNVLLSESGIFTNLTRPGNDSWTVKVNNIDGSYTEVTGLLLDQYISYGSCKNTL